MSGERAADFYEKSFSSDGIFFFDGEENRVAAARASFRTRADFVTHMLRSVTQTSVVASLSLSLFFPPSPPRLALYLHYNRIAQCARARKFSYSKLY